MLVGDDGLGEVIMTGSLLSFGLKEQVRADLEQQIDSGALAPGSKLPSERELSVLFRLGRPSVREVLRGLADQGYIEVHAGRGSFVRAPQVQDLALQLIRIASSVGVSARDLVGARLILEAAAARQASANATAEDIAALSRTLHDHECASSLDRIVDTDVAFHAAVCKASGNPVLEIMFGSIAPLVRGVILRSQSDQIVRPVGEPLHRVLLECISSGDVDGAERAIRRHISLALDLFGDDLDRPLSEVLERIAASPSHGPSVG
jgi:GntR family transcriptional repressor for pyruvate dehydrogenase complex